MNSPDSQPLEPTQINPENPNYIGEPIELADGEILVLPEEIELYDDEDWENILDDAVPLSNGWFAVDLGYSYNLWQIFDENGVTMGIFRLLADMDIENIDIDFLISNMITFSKV